MPGQTRGDGRGGQRIRRPSMEGRAIARPNPLARLVVALGRGPSMEGRAIARPNLAPAPATDGRALTFNGGPGNCPAKQGL